MAGFDNDVIYGSNIDFTGTSPVSGQINLNGELLVGATVAPFIRAYVPTGSSGVSISTGPGTLDFSLANIPNSALQNSSVSVISGANINATPASLSLGGTLTISAVGPISATTLTNHGVVIGQGTSALQATSVGSTGQVLQGNTGADPTYSTSTYPSIATGTGTILRADGTNWVATTSTYPSTNAVSTLLYASSANVMSALTTANDGLLVTSHTGVPSILAGPGAAGKVLQSNTAAAPSYSTPTYPSASGTARTILVSDATNNIYSTETWAVPGASGNILTSNGTNWTSAAPSGVLTATKTLLSAQVKALHATPIEIIATPGSGKGILIINQAAKLNYGGSNVFTAGAAQRIEMYYSNNTTIVTPGSPIVSNAMLVSSANKFSTLSTSTNFVNSAAGVIDNVNVAAWNSVATEISGNAAGDNTVDIIVNYIIVTF